MIKFGRGGKCLDDISMGLMNQGKRQLQAVGLSHLLGVRAAAPGFGKRHSIGEPLERFQRMLVVTVIHVLSAPQLFVVPECGASFVGFVPTKIGSSSKNSFDKLDVFTSLRQ
jgi:hypothetical protein